MRRPVVRNAVRAYLQAGRGSIGDIAAATGRSVYSIRDAIRALEAMGDPCIANLALHRRDEPTAAGTVSSGIASRTALERAWAGEVD